MHYTEITSPDGFIPAIAISEFLKDKKNILIIGDFTKRDYNNLSSQDKTISVLDIVKIDGIKNFYQQSITEPTPFSDQTFDGVVLAEVIEHLFEDYIALKEIHRILKADGTLVITVPYFSNVQDEPEFHVRVHSPNTIRRLLEFSGFKIEEHFYRGLISRFPQKNRLTNYLTFGSLKCLQFLIGKTKGLKIFQKLCFNLEYFLGSHSFFTPIQKKCTSFGGIMKIKKSCVKDFLAIQQTSFSQTNQ